MQPSNIAVVVPAWKPDFLREALSSIEAQSGMPFDVYIFDDAAPPAVGDICRDFPKFRYFRFEKNMGSTSLVAHWNRCLHHISNEWVWLFSDDDVMCPGSMQAVQEAIQSNPDKGLFQLSVKMTSTDLTQTMWASNPPEFESARSFLQARFQGLRLSCLPDHVFSWHRLRQMNNGFIEFPLGWNSDDATWVTIAGPDGIVGVPVGQVLWRQSSLNISADTGHRWIKLAADLKFLAFLDDQRLLDKELRKLSRYWLRRRLTELYGFKFRDGIKLWKILPIEMRTILPLVVAKMLLRRRTAEVL
jgi:glycosyltransferase involved in cell wall biosynthesis